MNIEYVLLQNMDIYVCCSGSESDQSI